MKRLWLIFCLLLALLCLLAACKQERTIAKSEVVNGELILTYSDGSTENLGSVVNALAQNAQAGEVGAVGAVGEKGEAGITPQIRINQSSNEWEVSTDNGQSWTSTGVVATGAQGPQGENAESLPAENLQKNLRRRKMGKAFPTPINGSRPTAAAGSSVLDAARPVVKHWPIFGWTPPVIRQNIAPSAKRQKVRCWRTVRTATEIVSIADKN